jgi:acyl-CoA thioester hydrolase
MDHALGRYPVSVAVPVAWGEMDAFEHVNNVNFARWVETGRVAYFTRLGLMCPQREDGVGPILARLSVDYLRPVSFPDTVRVDATVTRIGKSSLTMAYRIWSQEQHAEAARGEDVIVVFDYTAGRKAPVDEALRAAIHALEATGRRGPGSRGGASGRVRPRG